MPYYNRNQRLKAMIGQKQNLCFQVVVGVQHIKDFSSEEEFNEAAAFHGIKPEGSSHIAYLPKKNHIEKLKMFAPGFICSDQIVHLSTQALYTKIIERSEYIDTEQSDDLDRIMGRYVPLIEREYPDLSFADRRYADSKALSVEFKFLVRPYKPEICHPNDRGVLKPLTLLNKPIKPL